MPYFDDRAIEDKFSDTIKNILGHFFIEKIELEDLEKARDFAIYHIKPFSVAVRFRRYEYYQAFHNEFTIRWTRPSGAKTEINKIREGHVNYLLYGFLSPSQDAIIQYFIADLEKFGNPQPQKIYLNDPNDSELAVFNLNQFPSDFIVKFYQNPSYSIPIEDNEPQKLADFFFGVSAKDKKGWSYENLGLS